MSVDKPKHLSQLASELWDAAAFHAVKLGTLDDASAPAFAEFCEADAAYHQLARRPSEITDADSRSRLYRAWAKGIRQFKVSPMACLRHARTAGYHARKLRASLALRRKRG